jgi:hypothetical protein
MYHVTVTTNQLLTMESVSRYNIFGPASALKRMPLQLFENIEPQYLYTYDSSEHKDIVQVAIFEEYEKQINASVTLTCMIIYTGTKMQFIFTKTGGRVGFRGSSMNEEKRTIDDDVIDFIIDFSKRHGLSMQQQQESISEEDED